MGTLIHDSLAPNLRTSAAITSTATGSAVRSAFTGLAQFEVAVGAVSGTSPTLDVSIESAWNSAFSQGKVVLGNFPTAVATDANSTKAINAYIDAPYVRAVFTVSGTSPSFVVGVKVREPHLNRVTPGPGMPGAPGTGTGFPDAN